MTAAGTATDGSMTARCKLRSMRGADPVQEIAELRALLAEREAELAGRGPS